VNRIYYRLPALIVLIWIIGGAWLLALGATWSGS
jgi:hypothetical protein